MKNTITFEQLKKLISESSSYEFNYELWHKAWEALKNFHKDVELRMPRYYGSYSFIDVHNVPEDIDIDEFANKILSICHENGIDDMHVAGSTPLHYTIGPDYREATADWFRLYSDKHS